MVLLVNHFLLFTHPPKDFQLVKRLGRASMTILDRKVVFGLVLRLFILHNLYKLLLLH